MASENKIIMMYLVMPGHIKNIKKYISMEYYIKSLACIIKKYNLKMTHNYVKTCSDTQHMLFLFYLFYSTCHCTSKYY